MCKLTSKIRAGNAVCAGGSGWAIVSGTPMAAAAAELKGTVAFGMNWNEIGIIVGAIVGIAGLVFSQYWAHLRNKREQELHAAQVAALKKG